MNNLNAMCSHLSLLICQHLVFSSQRMVKMWIRIIQSAQVIPRLFRFTQEQDVSFTLHTLHQTCASSNHVREDKEYHHSTPVHVQSTSVCLTGMVYYITVLYYPLCAYLKWLIFNYFSVWIYSYYSFCSHAGIVMYIIHMSSVLNVELLLRKQMKTSLKV